MDDLRRRFGFDLVGYGCTTCIGNSGPLPGSDLQEPSMRTISWPVRCLSGNRNFEGRIIPTSRRTIWPHRRWWSPMRSPAVAECRSHQDPLGVGLRRQARLPQGDLAEPKDRRGRPHQRHRRCSTLALCGCLQGRRALGRRSAVTGRSPMIGMMAAPMCVFRPISRASPWSPEVAMTSRAPKVLALLGDSITTDHISPAGSPSPRHGPGGNLLHGARQIRPTDFNSYGSRRGNHEVMMRGTFANIRLQERTGPRHGRRLDPGGPGRRGYLHL